MINDVILKIRHLKKDYGNFKLNCIDLELKSGRIMGFVGPNGAGKSTTIKSIINIIPFDSGEILIDGMSNVKDEIAVKEIVGYVGEQANFYNDVYAYQIYKFVKRFYKKWDDTMFYSLIQKFDVNLNKKIKQLSKGNVMKFSLAIALSHHPKLLIMDEPTSGLDPIIRNEVLDTIKEIVKNEKCSVFFSSHITEDIEKIADDITYIFDGRILLTDTKENILSNYKKITFKDRIPQDLEKHLVFFKDNVAIVNNMKSCDSILSNNNIKSIDSALVDDILLFLIKEDANV